MANRPDNDDGAFDDGEYDDEIDWSSIPLNSISSSMSVPATTNATMNATPGIPTAAAAADDDDDVDVDALRRRVRDLRRMLDTNADRLADAEADAAVARVESARRSELAERTAGERVRLVEEELRRTRIEAERYRSGWTRLSSAQGGRKRRAAVASSAAETEEAGPDVRAADAPPSRFGGGGPLRFPPPVDVDRRGRPAAGSSREVTPRSGDGGGGRRIEGSSGRGDRRIGGEEDRPPPSSSGGKRKSRSHIGDDGAVDDDDDNDDEDGAGRGWIAHCDSTTHAGAETVGPGRDDGDLASRRRTTAMRLLDRGGGGMTTHSSLLLRGIEDRDGDDGDDAGAVAGRSRSRDGRASARGIDPAPNGGRRIGRGQPRLVVVVVVGGGGGGGGGGGRPVGLGFGVRPGGEVQLVIPPRNGGGYGDGDGGRCRRMRDGISGRCGR